MEPVVGVICEYDPFHRGHARQFALIKEKWPNAAILCLMSGCFTQRGAAAMHSPAERAKAALRAGADLVLELPCAFALRDGEHFALGGVEILTRLGFVTHLCFGAEDALPLLKQGAALLEEPSPAFQAALREALDEGCSFAAAQGRALKACLGGDAWQKPNNILALCYLRALWRLHSPLIPVAVERQGDYHGETLKAEEWPSATAVRAAFWRGEYQQASEACGYALPKAPVCPPDALDRVLLYKLRSASISQLSALSDCSEGLENRLRDCAARATSREELLSLLKTRRYARARLSRLCTHALLDVTAEWLNAHPRADEVRLLGLRRGTALTALLRQSQIRVIDRPAAASPSGLLALDQRAWEMWALGAGLPSGFWYTQGVCVVEP